MKKKKERQKERSFVIPTTLLHFSAYFLFPLFSLWESALAAAVLHIALVLPSLKTFDAAEAVALLVTFLAIIFKFVSNPNYAGGLIPA